MPAQPDDHRRMGQESFLMHAELMRIPYRAPSREWDHDHCEFCGATFTDPLLSPNHFEWAEEDSEVQVGGYTTTSEHPNGAGYHWICERCFEDFRDEFDWSLADADDRPIEGPARLSAAEAKSIAFMPADIAKSARMHPGRIAWQITDIERVLDSLAAAGRVVTTLDIHRRSESGVLLSHGWHTFEPYPHASKETNISVAKTAALAAISVVVPADGIWIAVGWE